MAAVQDVEIDPDGTFKYILVRLQRPGSEERRDIVRGTKAAEFHNHIFEKVNPEMEKLGYECKCLGGGKIDHNSKEKKIRVYGASTFCPEKLWVPEAELDGALSSLICEDEHKVKAEFSARRISVEYRPGDSNNSSSRSEGYGKADHSVTVEILKKVYTDYEITWSDDKK